MLFVCGLAEYMLYCLFNLLSGFIEKDSAGVELLEGMTSGLNLSRHELFGLLKNSKGWFTI